MATLLTAASAQTAYDRFFDEYYFPVQPHHRDVGGHPQVR